MREIHKLLRPFSVIADQVVCLIQKVQSPVTATNGAMDISTVSASFAFAAPSVIVRPYSQTDTTIIMDSSLVLVKRCTPSQFLSIDRSGCKSVYHQQSGVAKYVY
jgi:hypothetical protein